MKSKVGQLKNERKKLPPTMSVTFNFSNNFLFLTVTTKTLEFSQLNIHC